MPTVRLLKKLSFEREELLFSYLAGHSDRGIELMGPGRMEETEKLTHSGPWTLQVKSLFSQKRRTLCFLHRKSFKTLASRTVEITLPLSKCYLKEHCTYPGDCVECSLNLFMFGLAAQLVGS